MTTKGSINMGFWAELRKKRVNDKPFFALAPMALVTDFAFREIITENGKPDVLWTEFVSSDGLISRGRENLLIDLKFSRKQRPIIAQIFGSNPEKMRETAKLIEELGFDGIDINMGCPDKKILKQNAGASLISNPKLAKEIIRAVKEGAPKIPVSVKTRIGSNTDEVQKWIPALLEEGLSALTIHGRTRKEMSKVPAHWEKIEEVVSLRDKISPETVIIGNGDVKSIEDGFQKSKESGCDGIMVGRGVFGNPWFFNQKSKERKIIIKKQNEGKILDVKNKKEREVILQKIKIMLKHSRVFVKTLGKQKSFHILKKHFKAYISNFNNALEFRSKLMEKSDLKSIERETKAFLKNIL